MAGLTRSNGVWVSVHESGLRESLPDDRQLEWSESDLTHKTLMNMNERGLLDQHPEGHWCVDKRLYDWLDMELGADDDVEDEEEVKDPTVSDDGQIKLDTWLDIDDVYGKGRVEVVNDNPSHYQATVGQAL